MDPLLKLLSENATLTPAQLASMLNAAEDDVAVGIAARDDGGGGAEGKCDLQPDGTLQRNQNPLNRAAPTAGIAGRSAPAVPDT